MSQAAGAQADGAHGTVRVFLLDDHEVVRRGLRDLLDAEADIEVIGDAGTAESAMNRATLAAAVDAAAAAGAVKAARVRGKLKPLQ